MNSGNTKKKPVTHDDEEKKQTLAIYETSI